MTDGTPDGPSDQIEMTFHVYGDSLTNRGYGWERVPARVALLAPLWGLAEQIGLDAALGKVRTLVKRLRDDGWSEGEVSAFLAAAKDFRRWRSDEVLPLTDERVDYLLALQGRVGPTVPAERTVDRVLRAIDNDQHQGLVDATAVYLAGYHALSAQDICALRVSHWLPRVGLLIARACPAQSLSLVRADEWLVASLTHLVAGREGHEPLLSNERGEALTPTRLQQRFARLREGFPGEVEDGLSLERLREYGAYWMLDNGATWADLALAFGYTRVGSVRRRFCGEAWEYLADRDGNWFSVAAAAKVEGLTPEQLAHL